MDRGGWGTGHWGQAEGRSRPTRRTALNSDVVLFSVPSETVRLVSRVRVTSGVGEAVT